MPDFGNSFSGLTVGRTLSKEELIRAIRFMVAAEYEAVQLYMQLAESTDNELAKMVLADISNEELVHAGEFLTLLKQLAPEEEGFYEQGRLEVEEMMKQRQEGKPQVAETGKESTVTPTAATVGSLLGS